jgi:hypothetical protein
MGRWQETRENKTEEGGFQMKRALLAFLLLAAISFPYDHPVFSASLADAQDNATAYTFKSLNQLDTPTTGFRLWLSGGFDWFNPKDFTYAFQPDGYDGYSPYWDLPPILPNESMEVSFSVGRLVGLPESIDVRTEPLSRWNGTCAYLKPYNSSASVFYIQDFLNRTNRSQGITIYYDDGGQVLARLEGYKSFAVFTINGYHVEPISDAGTIREIVDAYTSASKPSEARGNVSALYQALLLTADLKERPESECYKLTGMERYPCVDRKSCMFACFSVPVCSALGQSGWSFMDTLLDYNRSVVDANAKLRSAISSSKAFSKGPTHSSAMKAFDDLVALNRAETKVVFHPLFTSYGFCEPAKYGIPQQTSARRELLDYLASTCLDGESERIVNESLKAAPLLAARPVKNDSIANETIDSTANQSIVTNQTALNQTAPDGSIKNQTANQSAVDGATAQNESSAQNSCCLYGICSLGGIERVGGVCWEWSVFSVMIAALVLAAIFYMKKK